MRIPFSKHGLATMTIKTTLALGLALSARGAAAQAQQFYSVTPCRVADTRSASYNVGAYLNGTPSLGGTVRGFFVKGLCHVPGTAKAVTVNATVINPPGQGWLALFPGGTSWPGISTLNFAAGSGATANGAVVPLSGCTPPCGDLNVWAPITGTLDFVLDVTGYFQ